MKIKFFTIILALTVSFIQAQQKTLNEITSFKIRNSGAMMDVNNDVDGYYFYYEIDKLKKGMREYAIKILDKNLNEIATKSYVDNKNTILAQSKFNNHSLMFAMINLKERQYKLVQFDREGNKKSDVVIPVSKKEVRWLSYMMKSGNYNLLYSIDNKGFLFNYIRDNKKIGYGLKYVATDGGKSWDFNSSDTVKEIQSINPIMANDQVVIALQSNKKAMLSSTINMKIIVIDINTGKKLFEQPYDRSNDPRLVTNAFITDDKKIIIMGEYYASGDNILKAKSLGLFAQQFDFSGNELGDNKVSWKSEIDPIMPPESDGKKNKRGYVYFHDIQKTSNGYYCIGERYRKTVSLKGMLLNGQIGRGMTQLTITDAVLFNFDENFKLGEINVFKKGKSRVQNLTDFGSPQLNAHIIKAIGGFDYEFTQKDPNRDRFYAMFIDYERLKGEKNKNAFKSIIYDNGKITEDKIYLENSKGKITTRVLPGKLGNVLLLEYNRKEKTLNIHLEKLNIE